MKTIRYLAFSLMCLMAVLAMQQRALAYANAPWYSENRPTVANGCDVYEDPSDIYLSRNHGCPTIGYTGSCNWAAGCLDALVAAEEVCDWWEEHTDTEYGYLVILFDCTDPMEAPTDFSFTCDPWSSFGCFMYED